MKKTTVLIVEDELLTAQNLSIRLQNLGYEVTVMEKSTEEVSFFSNDFLFIRKRERHYRVKYADILWVEAQSNYSVIVTNQEKYILAITLGKLGADLPVSTFVRANRSFIVNKNHIDSIEGNSIFINEQRIPVSKSNRASVFSHFHIL